MERLTTQVPQNLSYGHVLPGLEQKEKVFVLFRAYLVQIYEAPKHNTFHFFLTISFLSQSRNPAKYPME